MLNRLLGTLYHSMLSLRLGGPRAFFQQLKRRIYSRTTYILLEKNLETAEVVVVPSRLEYSLRLATEEDMEEAFQLAKSEKKEEASGWVDRKRCYESGYHNCYVARTADTGELCHVHWLITSEEDKVARRRFLAQRIKVKDGECLLEKAYTFEKYRGQRIHNSVQAAMCEIARARGFKRVTGYVPADNVASVKGGERGGFQMSVVSELKLFFFTRWKHTEEDWTALTHSNIGREDKLSREGLML